MIESPLPGKVFIFGFANLRFILGEGARQRGEGTVFNLLTAGNLLVTNVQTIALKFYAQSIFVYYKSIINLQELL